MKARHLALAANAVVAVALSASCATSESKRAEYTHPAQASAPLDPPATVGLWKRIDTGIPPFACAGCMAYDPANGTTVAMRVSDARQTMETWLWDGKAWKEASPPASPPVVPDGFALARHDSIGHVLFVATNEIWAWDGTTWAKLPGSAGPKSGMVAYDAARDVLVLVPTTIDQPLTTYVWNQTRWAQPTGGAAPSARIDAAMAYDATRQRVVMFGGTARGVSAKGALSDTLEWDGTKWTTASTAAPPSARAGHTMVYDAGRQRVVLVGGKLDDGTFASDAWTWEGTTWQALSPGAPVARSEIGAAYDGKRATMVLAGGASPSGVAGERLASDTWELTNGAWTMRAKSTPDARLAPVMAFDAAHARTVLFGGHDRTDTWTWDGASWNEEHPAHAPGQREAASMTYDGARGQVVMFAGRAALDAGYNETWTWNGSDWTLQSPASAPSFRWSTGLTYDETRQRVVMFGGFDKSIIGRTPAVNDTWEWDGTTWTKRSPAQSPPARAEHALAYDRKHGRTLLFGGGPFTDTTWTWDGIDWSQSVPAIAPVPRSNPRMVEDSRRKRIVMFGGEIPVDTLPTTIFADTWEWDGDAWSQMATSASPAYSESSAGAFDGQRGRFVYFGEGETWEYEARGGVCASDADCDSHHCVDGVCCAASSCGTCEACVVGANDVTCAKVTQGGADPDTCPGACDGAGVCKTKGGAACTSNDECATHNCVGGVCCGSASCGQFACGADGLCKTACANDLDCASPLRCDVSTHACTAGGSCDADGVTAIHPNGDREACGAFRCAAGACKQSCATNDDCASPSAVCDERGACIDVPARAAFRSCGVSKPLRRGVGGFFGLFVFAAAALARRARRDGRRLR